MSAPAVPSFGHSVVTTARLAAPMSRSTLHVPENVVSTLVSKAAAGVAVAPSRRAGRKRPSYSDSASDVTTAALLHAMVV